MNLYSVTVFSVIRPGPVKARMPVHIDIDSLVCNAGERADLAHAGQEL